MGLIRWIKEKWYKRPEEKHEPPILHPRLARPGYCFAGIISFGGNKKKSRVLYMTSEYSWSPRKEDQGWFEIQNYDISLFLHEIAEKFKDKRRRIEVIHRPWIYGTGRLD